MSPCIKDIWASGCRPKRDDGEVDAGGCLEQFGREILGASDIDRPDIERAGFCLCGSDEVAERFELRAGAGTEDEIEKSQAGNGLEIPKRIERQLLEQGDADRSAVG